MLPDPEKNYAGDDVLTALWTQFAAALQRARMVLVLGHSLSDRLLVGAIRENLDPRRLDVAVYSDESGGGPDPSAAGLANWVREHIPEAKLIPMRFAPQITARWDILGAWLTEVEQLPPIP